MKVVVKASLQDLMLTFSNVPICTCLSVMNAEVPTVPVAPGTSMLVGSDQ